MTTALANDRLLKRFQKWDADADGQLEREDFTEEAAKIAHAFGKAPDAREVQALRDAFDSLYNYLAREAGVPSGGAISQDAFLRVTGNLIYQGGEANFNRALGPVVKAIIGICDKNADGKINAEEFEAWMAGIGVNRSEAREAFTQVDTNGDGELSLNELLAAVRDYHFGRLDVELLG
ncbi:EF-hand domain-containing protein [Streptomyces sp. HMX87]|uniref:EF-hand domain-containing protein n=1 Tax=Streptomyces sp. HMX87 TaxID=3390849 RepID=UPI003A89FC46